jgi:pimeloyl-ACP methyl ester carboxylesterase
MVTDHPTHFLLGQRGPLASGTRRGSGGMMAPGARLPRLPGDAEMRELFLSDLDAAIRFHDLAGAAASSAPALIFIHGLGCAAADYVETARDQRLATRRAILVDLPGFGFSDRPADFSYTLEAHAACVLRLIDALRLERATLFGHSMGGAIAVRCAAARPALCAGLILAEPRLGPGPGALSGPIAAQSEAAYVAAGHEALLRECASRVPGEVRQAGFVARMHLASPLALHRSARAVVADSTPTTGAMLAGLALPRTLLYGALSTLDATWRAAADAGVRLVSVAGAGHDMMQDAPDAFVAALADASDALDRS